MARASKAPAHQELTVISQVALALNGSIELAQALDVTLGKAADLLGLETGWIWLMTEDGTGFYLAASRALPPGFAANPAWVQGSCYCQTLFRSGEMEAATNIDVIGCSRLQELADAKRTAGFRYHASVPLVAHGKRLGVMNLASRDWRELGDAELRLLRTVSDMVAVAVERTRLFRRSQELGALLERQRVAQSVHAQVATALAQTRRALERLERSLTSRRPNDEWRDHYQAALAQVETSLDATRQSLNDLGGLGQHHDQRPTLSEAVSLLDRASAPRPQLTRREWQLLAWLARGLSNQEIASQAGISVRTVKFHVSALLDKFDAVNRTEVVARALQLGMIRPDEEPQG